LHLPFASCWPCVCFAGIVWPTLLLPSHSEISQGEDGPVVPMNHLYYHYGTRVYWHTNLNSFARFDVGCALYNTPKSRSTREHSSWTEVCVVIGKLSSLFI
jgi:hypothetical protein